MFTVVKPDSRQGSKVWQKRVEKLLSRVCQGLYTVEHEQAPEQEQSA